MRAILITLTFIILLTGAISANNSTSKVADRGNG